MSKIDEAFNLLKELEWGQKTGIYRTCRWCLRYEIDGHTNGCKFSKALALLESAKAAPEAGEPSGIACMYCGKTVLFETDKLDECLEIMTTHDRQCTANPLKQQIDAQVEGIEEIKARVHALTAEKQAQAERIAELNADKVQLENDACVARGEINRLTAENERLRDDTDCETESGGILCIEQADQIERLTQQLAKAVEQNYCTTCGKTRNGYVPPTKAEPEPSQGPGQAEIEAFVSACDGDITREQARKLLIQKEQKTMLQSEKQALTAEVARLNYYIDVVLREMKELQTKLKAQVERIAELEQEQRRQVGVILRFDHYCRANDIDIEQALKDETRP